ncbi:hypothetical protein DFH06DRAFT_1179443 [Mycena polygramma]|nr:hypothetical protein DFH06DRAFT_1179443 [Mycena polygramma]
MAQSSDVRRALASRQSFRARQAAAARSTPSLSSSAFPFPRLLHTCILRRLHSPFLPFLPPRSRCLRIFIQFWYSFHSSKNFATASRTSKRRILLYFHQIRSIYVDFDCGSFIARPRTKYAVGMATTTVQCARMSRNQVCAGSRCADLKPTRRRYERRGCGESVGCVSGLGALHNSRLPTLGYTRLGRCCGASDRALIRIL